MKYISFLAICLLLLPGEMVFAQRPGLVIRNYDKNAKNAGQPKYSIEQFIGRWQETGRINSKTNEKVAVNDTFYIRFYKEDKADTRQGNSMMITGTTEVFRDDYITTSANDFKIVSVTTDQIVLDGLEGFLHVFSRTALFNYELTLPPPAPDNDTTMPIVDINAISLAKDWFAYKREASPGFITSETPVIRNLNIVEKIVDNNYKGLVEFAKSGKALIQPCTLNFNGKMLTITAEGNTWNIEVYKAGGRELILGKIGELVYYFKSRN